MQSKRARLDRFVSARTGINRREVKTMLARGRITVDGSPATLVRQLVDEFTHVTLDDQVLQANTPVYLMMNKASGLVSATKDKRHKTVVDCLNASNPAFKDKALHIVGRLDYRSTGLILLTNDGRWSRGLTTPEKRVSKVYRVTLANPITNKLLVDRKYKPPFSEFTQVSGSAIWRWTRPGRLLHHPNPAPWASESSPASPQLLNSQTAAKLTPGLTAPGH